MPTRTRRSFVTFQLPCTSQRDYELTRRAGNQTFVFFS